MIQLLSEKYNKSIAYLLLLVFSLTLETASGTPVEARYTRTGLFNPYFSPGVLSDNGGYPFYKVNDSFTGKKEENRIPERSVEKAAIRSKTDIGGPGQPEMSSFKSVGTDNMVNLFTGDFSYNIPLLDVGGYPINIFYDGGITMEQEASWVGLGWNINPGTVSRNMRGVPDDFDGTDMLVQSQQMKPNKTWGASLGADLELLGIKGLGGHGSLGVSVNNYLGPALELGYGTGFSVTKAVLGEKNALPDLSVGLSANLSSRYGLSFSPNVSLTASAKRLDKTASFGIGVSTSYNSRSGIKALQLSEQVSFSREEASIKAGENVSVNLPIYATSISFARPSYIPSIRMPLTNTAHSARFQLGGGIFGAYGSMEAEVYLQNSEVASTDITQEKPLVGYLYYQKAVNNSNAVMDFTRFNDGEVTPNTPIISVPQYTYDVFSIQGEGTGGSIRAYRNDLGYVRDNTTSSRDKSVSLGVDAGPPGHYGANYNIIKTPSVISEWMNGNKLRNVIGFTGAAEGQENVYFRNPGETSVLNEKQFEKIGGTDLVRFKLGGTREMPAIEPVLKQYSKSNRLVDSVDLSQPERDRKKRTQVISFLTAKEASEAGLDIVIKSYKPGLDVSNNLQYDPISRESDYRKSHHISQINVTEANGKRYVYGIPVYNIVQKDFSFSVNASGDSKDQVAISATEPTTLNQAKGKDGYLQITETPAYAHSFLLSGLLSPDYVDVTGDGITEDDLGNAVKFNYTKFSDHQWRTPLPSGLANFNAGSQSENKDDKGLISYGERESWYLHSVESKTMIALFTVEDRADGKGVVDPVGAIKTSETSLKRLKKIDLYSKADLKKNGLTGARPIKTVWFAYSYSLCAGTPDNPSGGGKLTLDSIYFTFNGKSRINKNKYVFSYGGSGTNSNYSAAASDRWGNYKPALENPGALKNADYPYALQDKSKKAVIDSSAASWALKKILLPSGGQIEVEYESDDYAFVQNRRAADMMEISGMGKDATITTGNKLYSASGLGNYTENVYVFIKVPEACTSRAEVYQKYLEGQDQLAFKILVNMPKGPEYITSYASVEDYGYVSNDSKIWIRLRTTDNLNPLSLTALEYLREQLPGQAFKGYDVSESSGLKQVGEMLAGMLSSLKNAFSNPLEQLRSEYKAQTIVLGKSFVRLNDPDGYKYGGGHRVKSVKLKDNWQAMTGQYTSVYGQEYSYETTETFNGTTRTISSGVASYEPSVGGEENPFQTIVQVSNKLPLGPASYGAVELPVMDAFFPAPLVGYSKVTVRALRKDTDTTKRSRSGIGKQVTEFYTAKDFPVYYNRTSFDLSSDMQEHQAQKTDFFYKYAFDSRALSQGFLVETNDMHGKIKSQSSYAESDSLTPISYTENFYRNTGSRGLDEKFDFVFGAQADTVREGNMGIDIELMTDTREFAVTGTSFEVQGQVDLFPVVFPFWLPFIWPVSGNTENTYRAVTTTKVVNYHGILDSVVVVDKGSRVSTKNLVYDAETGHVVVSRTNNEFDLPVYNVSYPAYQAYSGMGPAYRNIDAVYSGVSFLDGRINGGMTATQIKNAFESGDELYIMDPGSPLTDNCGSKISSASSIKTLWAFDTNKNTGPLTNLNPDFVFIDSLGKIYSRSGVTLRVIRSGKRNILDAPVATVSLMKDPVATAGSIRKLVIDGNSNVINATALEYREKWQADNDVIKRITYGSVTTYPDGFCPVITTTETPDCYGELERYINPYVKGLLGNFRTHRSMVFYGARKESDPLAATDLKQNGFLDSFDLYWKFNTAKNLVPDISNTRWVWNSQVTRINAKGLELETKDALNIYTAAQYGYNKSMPVAIANNARYHETFYEGFEDKNYTESINNIAAGSCNNLKHIDLSGSLDSVNAHSGTYALAVNANSSFSKTLPVTNQVVDSFNLMLNPGSKNYGQWMGGVSNPRFYRYCGSQLLDSLGYPYESTCFEDFTAITKMCPYEWNQGCNSNINPCAGNGEFTIIMHFFYKAQASGTYSLTSFMNENGGKYMLTIRDNPALEPLDFNTIMNNPDLPDLHYYGNYYYETPYYNSPFNCTAVNPMNNTFQYKMCKDNVYEFTIVYKPNPYAFQPTSCGGGSFCPIDLIGCGISMNNGFNQVYATKYQQDNICNFTKPLAATDSMLNPSFSISPDKKMLFSAWVKEDCAPVNGEPCSTYANNQVKLQFNDGSNKLFTLQPAGPIIEGWQRYESAFTAPAGATQMTLSFVNNSSQAVYFDDIRIHPFNANMKSYVYDPVNLRLTAELDANNYATFYEYDEEGTLVRTKAETKEGVKTINETRSFKQTVIKEVQ